MGVFDKLRDAATMRSYEAIVAKGDPEKSGMAAVVAVNRLGSEGLARLDPAKAEGVALKALGQMEVPSAAYGHVAMWADVSKVPLPAIKDGLDRAYERVSADRIRDDASAKIAIEERMESSRESGEAMRADNALWGSELEKWAADDVVFKASQEAGRRDQLANSLYDEDEKDRKWVSADSPEGQAALARFNRAGQEMSDELAGENPSDDALQAWEEEIQETGSSYDFDEIGNEYEVAFGKSDKGFHYSLTGANADDRNWSAPFPTQEEAEASLSKSQDTMYRTGDYESGPDASQKVPAVSDATAKDIETAEIDGVRVVTASFEDGFHYGWRKNGSHDEREWSHEAYPTREAAVHYVHEEALNQRAIQASESGCDEYEEAPSAHLPDRTPEQLAAFEAAFAPRPPTPDFWAALADGEKPEPGMRPR